MTWINRDEAFRLDVQAENMVPFRILAEFTGEGKVEVYDLRYSGGDFGPEGQFTGARCSVSQLLGEDEYGSGVSGWNLDGGVESWTIDTASMSLVRRWLRTNRTRVKLSENRKSAHRLFLGE